MLRPVRAVVLSCSALALLVSTTSAQTLLRWKFEPGQVLNQTISQEMKSSVNFGGQEIGTTVTQTIDAVWKVGAVAPDGTAKVEQEITRIRMKMNAPMMNVDFDSDAEGQLEGFAATMEPALKAMAKSKFTMKMTTLGEIVDVQVAQATLDALKALPGMGAASALSKDSLVTMIKQGTPVMPKEAVQSGAKWTNSMEVPLPPVGTMSSETELTYLGSETVDGKPLEKIQLETTMKIVGGAGPLGDVALKDQSALGQLYFDSVAGRLSHSVVDQQMTLQVPIAGNNVDQKVNQKITVQLTPAAR